MERKTRKPTQKRALEKVDRIVDAAFKLFNEKGYYNTTTADIAKEADVATGSIYAYFEDKKDIYIQVIRKINDNFLYPTRDFWVKNNKPLNNAETAKDLFSAFLKLMLSYHNFSKTFHDEMEALKLLDENIKNVCNELEAYRLERTEEIFHIISIPFKSEEESKIFLHYSVLLVDDVCHKILYDNSVNDINLYIDICADMLYTLLESTSNYK